MALATADVFGASLYAEGETDGLPAEAVLASLGCGNPLAVADLARTGQTQHACWSVGAWIGAAYWFTASTSFANPAVTIGRTLTDTCAGIAPASAPAFIVAQLLGGTIGTVLAVTVNPAVTLGQPRSEKPVPLAG